MRFSSFVVRLLSVVPFASMASGATPQDPYRLPPPEVVEILDARPAPSVQMSPDGRWMFPVQREGR